MYGGFDVFKIYLAVKLHFTTNYDFFEYGGKVNCKLDTFTKRNDRYFFHKLSTKYNKDEILDFFVANFCENSKKWVGNLLQNDGRETYLNYRKVKDNFKYHFRSDLNNIANDFSSKRLSFDDGFRCIDGHIPVRRVKEGNHRHVAPGYNCLLPTRALCLTRWIYPHPARK